MQDRKYPPKEYVKLTSDQKKKLNCMHRNQNGAENATEKHIAALESNAAKMLVEKDPTDNKKDLFSNGNNSPTSALVHQKPKK